MAMPLSDAHESTWISRPQGYEPEGREFESLRARHSKTRPHIRLRGSLRVDRNDVLWTHVDQLEAQPGPLAPFLTPRQVISQTAGVVVSDAAGRVAEPEANEVLRCRGAPKGLRSESPSA
jgi:hypothetical protein